MPTARLKAEDLVPGCKSQLERGRNAGAADLYEGSCLGNAADLIPRIAVVVVPWHVRFEALSIGDGPARAQLSLFWALASELRRDQQHLSGCQLLGVKQTSDGAAKRVRL